MANVGYTKRFALPLGLFLFAVTIVSILFAEPRTIGSVREAAVIILTGPVRSLWYWPNARGPVPPLLLLVLFSLLPVLLLPAYSLKPHVATGILTISGAVLWIVSGSLLLAILFLD